MFLIDISYNFTSIPIKLNLAITYIRINVLYIIASTVITEQYYKLVGVSTLHNVSKFLLFLTYCILFNLVV
jgi:hypothetical protein